MLGGKVHTSGKDVMIYQSSPSQWTVEIGSLGDKKVVPIKGAWLKDSLGQGEDFDLINTFGQESKLSDEGKNFCLERIASIVSQLEAHEKSKPESGTQVASKVSPEIYKIQYNTGDETTPIGLYVQKGAINGQQSTLEKMSLNATLKLALIADILGLTSTLSEKSGISIVEESSPDNEQASLDDLAQILLEEVGKDLNSESSEDKIKALLGTKLEELRRDTNSAFNKKYDVLKKDELDINGIQLNSSRTAGERRLALSKQVICERPSY